MRVTQSMYYNNLQNDGNKVNRELFDVNKQISSGHKIQYAHEDATTFAQTMRLDNEIVTLEQSKKSAVSGLKFSNQTDTTLNDLTKTLDSFKVKLLQAASGTHSESSIQSTAKELEGLKEHLVTLANTSINGKYLFSGTAVNVKPIDNNGEYKGNNGKMNALLGSNVKKAYNIPGSDLFFGEETEINKKISLNVPQFNLTKQYPDVMLDSTLDRKGVAKDEYISTSSTIRDLMGDTDDVVDTVNAKHHFYISGTTSSGKSFKDRIDMRDDEKVADLLDRIGVKFGNTPNNQVVNVTLNEHGQIEIEDKLRGSSKLDFHMVGAVDFGASDNALVNNIDNLDGAETNFKAIANGTSTAAKPLLYVKEFMKSGFDAEANAATIEGINYDRTMFSADGAKLNSNVSQIVRSDNSFANNSTKLSEVFDLSQNNPDTLDGTVLKLSGTDINGNAFDATINLNSSGSTFSVGGSTFDIFNADETARSAVDADKMTYKQLNDVLNMVMSNQLPTANNASAYDAAVNNASKISETSLNSKGQITFVEKGIATSTKASLSLYDANSSDYSAGSSASVATFNANNSLTIRDTKTDFFARIDEAIAAVKEYKYRADGNSDLDKRNGGIQNAIEMIDDLSSHVGNIHSTVGVISQTLETSRNRTELLIVSTQTLRSETIDTDLADASLKLNQLTLNYQAMLSTVSRVSKLSLVNYL